MASFDILPSGMHRARILLRTDVLESGKKRQAFHTIVHEDEKEMRRMAAVFEAEELERSRTGVSDKLLFHVIATEWLAGYHHKVRPRTYTDTARVVNNRLIPKWGRTRLGSISEREVKRWITEMFDEGLSSSSVRLYYLPFKTILDTYMKNRSPCRDVPLPAQAAFECEPPTPEELDQLIDIVSGTPDEVNIRLICDSGVRRGEIHGLTYRDALSTAGYLHIRQATTLSETGWIQDEVKSKRSKRRVAVDEEIQQLIWERMISVMAPNPLTVRQKRERAKMEKDGLPVPPLPVFTPPESLEDVPAEVLDSLIEPRTPHAYSTRFREILLHHNAALAGEIPPPRKWQRRVELPPGTFLAEGTIFNLTEAPLRVFRYYDLRHFHASNMLASGVPDAYAAARLGHHPNILRSKYQHLLPHFEAEMDAAVVELSQRARGVKRAQEEEND